MSKDRSSYLALVTATLLSLTLSAPVTAQDSTPSIDSDAAGILAGIPVQEGGRIKPMDTYASFLLLRMNGKRSTRGDDGRPMNASAWMAEVLLAPERARDREVFLIANDEVLDAIGVVHEGKKKRDRYSYNELAPGTGRLQELSHQYQQIEEKDRSPVEGQVVNLSRNVGEFERALHAFDFARLHVTIGEDSVLQFQAAEPGQKVMRFSDIVTRGDTIRQMWMVLDAEMKNIDAESQAEEMIRLRAGTAEITRVFSALEQAIGLPSIFSFLPPPDAPADSGHEEMMKEWMTASDVARFSISHGMPLPQQIALCASIERAADAVETGNAAELKAALQELKDGGDKMAALRGEAEYIDLEVTYYRMKPIYYGLVFYMLSFLLVSFSWLRPGGKTLSKIITISQYVATAILVVGITMRCVIRGRPPVTTLYETILFVTAVAAIVGLYLEWVNRRKIAQAMVSILGTLGLFLAAKYETHDAQDTMPSLVAVLDTNFWLATHVTTVTMGYSAGLLAAGIAHVYVLGKVFGFKRDNDAFYRQIGRMVYGVICFGLFFSVVGTILGGIWANYSWGRFWGWDPKENGALMIVLWELAMLHARMSGYIKNPGFCLASILGGVIVAFSWWGVNLLGVGLHSYGFTSGVARVLATFYGVESLIVAVGILWFWLNGNRPRVAPPADTAPAETAAL